MELPHSVATEQALLGILLVANDNYALLEGRLSPDDFYVPMHAEIFKQVGTVIKQGLEANPFTVTPALVAAGHGGEKDVGARLAEMFTQSGMASEAGSLAYILSQYAFQRKVITTAAALTKAANDNQIEDARKLQEQLAALHSTFAKVPTETALEQYQRSFKAASEQTAMLATGVKAWDEVLGGIFPGSRYIIAGQGGAGKSALAINIAWNLAKVGRKVRWLSYEEKPEALWWRILARETDTPITSFRKGLTERQRVNVIERGADIGLHDFRAFYDVPDVSSMISACGECDLIVLDGMTTAPAPGGESMVDNAGIVTRYCATLSAKTGASVLILAHINSDAVKNGATMAGIYGGQAATFDPEGIVEVRRTDPLDKSKGAKQVTLSVIKNRYGESGGKHQLWFNGEYMRFSDAV